jgi:hypothetical protein
MTPKCMIRYSLQLSANTTLGGWILSARTVFEIPQNALNFDVLHIISITTPVSITVTRECLEHRAEGIIERSNSSRPMCGATHLGALKTRKTLHLERNIVECDNVAFY